MKYVPEENEIVWNMKSFPVSGGDIFSFYFLIYVVFTQTVTKVVSSFISLVVHLSFAFYIPWKKRSYKSHVYAKLQK